MLDNKNIELAKIGLLDVTFFSESPFDSAEEDEENELYRLGIKKNKIEEESQIKFYFMNGRIDLEKVTHAMKIAVYKVHEEKSDSSQLGKLKRVKINQPKEISIIEVYFVSNVLEKIVMEEEDFNLYWQIYKRNKLYPFMKSDN
jgi:hypothetical protein